jgi:DNA-binding NtrC family response regulator
MNQVPQKAPASILVIDDDPDILVAARMLLKQHFERVVTEANPTLLPRLLEQESFGAILLDMNFEIGEDSGREGLFWLNKILEINPQAVIILMTAYGDLDTAVSAVRQGATDFVLKPWDNQKLLGTMNAAVQLSSSRQEVDELRTRQQELVEGLGPAGGEMIGQSAAMRQVYDLIGKAAPTDANVLILGENGTGKELVAREVNRRSGRSHEPFVTVDLGAVSETLFESELFGHLKGAFTDAHKARTGRFQLASGGTLFLDEIGNLPLHLQGKLLSVLEQREVLPVGSDQPVPIDVRLLSATNRDLNEMVADGTFREDLLYRINTVAIPLPPLRERGDDIALLLEHFLQLYTRKYGMSRKRLSADALDHLSAHEWPGNVRELSHAVERALILAEGETLGPDAFLLNRRAGTESLDQLDLETYELDDVEKAVIRKVLLLHEGNISKAARELGITRTSLYRRMAKYGI